MLYLLAFLLLFGAVITAVLLLVDSVYSRAGLEGRVDREHGRHWSPEHAVLMDDPRTGRSMLPRGIRARLWLLLLVAFLLGCGVLYLAI